MTLEFTTPGYIEVFKDGVLLSRHRQEREAVESILKDDSDAVYEIRHPVTTAKRKKPVITATMTISGEILGNA